MLGIDGMKALEEATVAVFGIGGVGSYTVEALARSGVGRFYLIDDDTVCLTNLNRQLHATRKTIGMPKVIAMKDRILEINPKAVVETRQAFYLPANAEELISKEYDYIVDAIDTVTAKIDLVLRAAEAGIPIISCMGAGNKLDPTRFEVADIFDTSVCPLARVMRRELKSRGVKSLKVVYSKEEPCEPIESDATSCASGCVCPKGTTRHCTERRHIPGSVSFVPSVAGLIIAGEVVKDLTKKPAIAKTKQEKDFASRL